MFGRLVRPYSLAVAIATAVSVWSVSTQRAAGAVLDGPAGLTVALCGLLSAVLLVGGFWLRKDHWMRGGLLASAGYWAVVGAVVLLEHSDRDAEV